MEALRPSWEEPLPFDLFMLSSMVRLAGGARLQAVAAGGRATVRLH